MEALDHLVNSGPTATPEMSNEAIPTRRVRITAWSFLTLAGLVEAIVGRHAMQDDGVNYLDMGDAIVRGDWKMALNGIWSPLYPLLQGMTLRLLRPSSYSQFSVVHGVNFLIYLFVLGCFEFFLRAAVADQPQPGDIAGGTSPLPKWPAFAIGYSVFLWFSLSSITVQLVSPDMLMAGFLYLAVGLLLRIWARPHSFSRFVQLGAVLGLGYLAKAPVFPLAFVFFAIAWFLADGWRRATPRVFAALLAFLAVSAPWFVTLSHAKGRLTFGESAKFNYLIHVNGVSPDWFFQDLGTAGGRYIHPVRKIFDAPPVYEFSGPLKATSAIYDPSYWAEGATPRVSLKRELSVIHHWLRFYLDIFLVSQIGLLVGFVVLCFMGERKQILKQVTARWPVWLLGLAGLGMYALVYAELRYVAVFFTLFWAGLFFGLRMQLGREGRRVASLVSLAAVIATAGPALQAVARQMVKRQPHVQWQVAQDLERLGVMPGDRVARLPGHFGLAWGRLLGVNEVARIPSETATDFWCARPERQAQAIETLRRYDVRVLVVERPPPGEACSPGPEWHRVGDGTHYAFSLKPEPTN